MADPQTSFAANSKPDAVMHVAQLVMQSTIAMHNIAHSALPARGCFGCSDQLLPVALSRCSIMQVVGPSVRAFGMCVDATSTLVCEPLSSSIDMLLIPHLPQCFATLTSFFSAMPQLVRVLLGACD